ncbi:MAG: hypothetical protein R6U55_12525 [Desulfovermiculus sp.]
MVRQNFDAHVYMANWGTAVFMINLPLEAISTFLIGIHQVQCLLESFSPIRAFDRRKDEDLTIGCDFERHVCVSPQKVQDGTFDNQGQTIPLFG